MEKSKQRKKNKVKRDEFVDEPVPVDEEIDLDFSELMLDHCTSTPLEEKTDPLSVPKFENDYAISQQEEQPEDEALVEGNTITQNVDPSDLFIEENSLGFINIFTEEIPTHDVEEKTNKESCRQIPSAPVIEEETPLCLSQAQEHVIKSVSSPAHTELHKLNTTYLDIATLKPFTVVELNELYQNQYLPAIYSFEDEFINKELNEEETYARHPLYELLMKYQKSRQSLKINGNDIGELRHLCQKHYSNSWSLNKETIRSESYCSDRKLCRTYHIYESAVLNSNVVDQLKNDLKSLLELSGIVYTKNLYTSAICKLQIENRIRELLASVPCTTTEISANDTPSENLQDIRLSLTILFSFLRKPNVDSNVMSDIKVWILKLVAVQLRHATWQDHLFLLFHILRCPSEISTWAACCIQVPMWKLESKSPYETRAVHHSLMILMALLKPIKRRQEFLAKIKKDLIDPTQDNLWVLVDSEGEDVVENVNGPRENDMVSILNQIPLEKLFSCITCAIPKEDGYYIDSSDVSSHHLLKSIAFTIKLIEILGQGLKTYENERYRQFCKRLGRIIKHVLQYVSEMQEIFLTSQNENAARINLEYNYLVLRACFYIYNSQRVGTWQYLSSLSFNFLSKMTLYKLYYAFQTGFNHQIINDVKTNFAEKCADEQLIKNFVLNIVEMPSEDLYYLLQAFAAMICSRETYDWDFIQTVTLGLYEIGFVHESSREICYKSVKDLIGGIATKFPPIISVIIQRLTIDISKVSSFNTYLIKALPLELWQPTVQDLEIVANWLLNFPFETIESQTTRIIFNRLNWNFSQNGTLFLSYEIHVRTACLICEVSMKHVPETIGLSEISITNLVKTQTSRTQFANWCWNLLSRLRLHCMDQGPEVIKQFINDSSTFLQRIPELEDTQILCNGVSESRPLPVFVSILVSLIGHSVPQICHKGLEYIKLLLSDSRHTIVIRCLELIVPLFLECPDSLSSCDKFQTILTQLLNDRSYQKYTKDFVVIQAQKPVLLLFGYMIEHQLINYVYYGLQSPSILINLWFDCLTFNKSWYTNPNHVYIIDLIVRVAYQFSDAWLSLKSKIAQFFKDINVIKQAQPSGLFSLISGSSSVAFNGLAQPNTNTLWFSILLLELELECIEIDKGIWQEFLRQVSISPVKSSLDPILKKVMMLTGHNQIATNQLVIFKLATLIVSCPVDHFLFPIVCQQFFNLYLSRIPVSSDDQRFYEVFGISDRLYDSNTTQMKKIKKKLQDAVEYHTQNSVKEGEKSNLHNGCVKLFKAYLFWLEEGQLNKLNFETIPNSMVEARKLRLIFQGNHTHWTEYIDLSAVRKQQIDNANEWAKIIQRPTNSTKRSPSNLSANVTLNPKIKIAERLVSYDKPLDPPELFDIVKHPPMPKTYLTNSARSVFQRNFKEINEYAKKFSETINEHKQCDQIFLNLLSMSYKNVSQNIRKRVSCGSTCTGSVAITLQYQESKIDGKVVEKIESNRRLYDSILKQESGVPNEKVVIAISQILDATQYLADTYNQIKSGYESNFEVKHYEKIHSNGVELFYEMLSYMTDNTLACPISEDVCNYCAAKLKVFIQDNHNVEGYKLLEFVLARPDLINFIGDLFSPSLSPAPYFTDMYRIMIDSHFKKCSEHTIFVLFSKFDVISWLNKYKPSTKDVSTLLRLNLKGLEFWNQSHLAMIQGLIRRHLVHIFEYNFPTHCTETIEQVLIELSEHSFNPGVLNDLLSSLYQRAGCGSFSSEPTFDSRSLMIKFANVQQILSFEIINDLAKSISTHFHHQRLSHGLHGLYPKHSSYCRTLRALYGTLSYSYVNSCIATFSSMLIENLINMVWTFICQLFSPWIIPYFLNDMPNAAANWIQQLSENKVMLPWSQKYVEDAKSFLSLYTNVIQYTIETIPNSQIILNHVIHQYEVCFVNKSIPKYVLEPLHKALLTLPWQLFHPKLHHIDLIHRILQQFLPDCHAFIGSVFIQIDWTSWVRNCTDSDKSMVSLLSIFVKIAHEPSLSENQVMVRLFKESLQYPWHVLTATDLEPIFDWFILSCDPAIILRVFGKTRAVDAPLLNLLIIASSFGIDNEKEALSTQLKFEINAKRLLYVRMITRLLRACGTKHHQLLSTTDGTKAFNAVIVDLLTLIQKSTKNEKDNDRESILTSLFMEILGSMQTQSDTTARLFVNAVIRWQFVGSPQDISLLSLLCVVNTFKSFPHNICLLIEQTIFNYFKQTNSSDVLTTGDWRSIADRMINFTSIDVAQLIQHELLLCLHVYLLQKLRLCKTNGDKIELLRAVFVHLMKYKTTETTEGQWFLIIGLFIDVGMKSLNEASSFLLALSRFLLNEVAVNESWGEGFLGAIGLRRDSISNCKRMLNRCLACIIFSFYTDESYSDSSKVRNEYKTAIDELKLQISSKKYASQRESVLEVIKHLERGQEAKEDETQLGSAAIIRLFYNDHFLDSLESVWQC